VCSREIKHLTYWAQAQVLVYMAADFFRQLLQAKNTKKQTFQYVKY